MEPQVVHIQATDTEGVSFELPLRPDCVFNNKELGALMFCKWLLAKRRKSQILAQRKHEKELGGWELYPGIKTLEELGFNIVN